MALERRPEDQPPTDPLVPASQPKVVLVVDDERQVLTLIGHLLSQAGYEVLKAGSGGEALVLSRGYRNRIDLLVTDVEMAGMTGIELANDIIVERPATRVLLDSANPEFAQQTQFPFLAKPFSPKDLRTAVSLALENSGAVEAVSPLPAAEGDAAGAPGVCARRRWRPPHASIGWLLTVAVVLVLVPLVLYWSGESNSGPETVSLRALRGSPDPAAAQAGRPLILNLDLSGLAANEAVRIELADGAGHVAPLKSTASQGAVIRAESGALRPGVYFVRVYSSREELLREYMLRINK